MSTKLKRTKTLDDLPPLTYEIEPPFLLDVYGSEEDQIELDRIKDLINAREAPKGTPGIEEL